MYVPAPADVPDEDSEDGAVGGEGADGTDGPADDAGGADAFDTPVSEADMTIGEFVEAVGEVLVEQTVAALDDGGLLADPDPEDAPDGADDTGDADDARPAVEALGGPRGYQ